MLTFCRLLVLLRGDQRHQSVPQLAHCSGSRFEVHLFGQICHQVQAKENHRQRVTWSIIEVLANKLVLQVEQLTYRLWRGAKGFLHELLTKAHQVGFTCRRLHERLPPPPLFGHLDDKGALPQCWHLDLLLTEQDGRRSERDLHGNCSLRTWLQRPPVGGF